MLSAVVGINWGDEGKGRIVDYLAPKYDVVSRYQGGNNAGHTVVNDKGKFILNLLPSGILQDGTVNVLGTGMVIDIEHLVNEIGKLREGGIKISPKNLKISDRATICMPYHRLQDCLEEDRLSDKKFGSTRRGIGPVYSDKYMKKTIRMGDLFDLESIKEHFYDIVEWKNLIIVGGYHHEPIDAEEMYNWLKTYGEPLLPYICDTSEYLTKAANENKNILFEAQLGAMRDIDFGIYPYTSSSNSISAFSTIGAGIPQCKLDECIGIMKAYSTCVGEGPFTCELFGDEAEKLRKSGNEYGAATGRPRRVGGFDIVASKYGVRVQNATYIALTKLDVLSYMDKIPVCVAYEYDGKTIDFFPSGNVLNKAVPVYEYLDGWKEDISKCRSYSELPENARKYIEYIEKNVCCKIKYISVGAERDALIEK